MPLVSSRDCFRLPGRASAHALQYTTGEICGTHAERFCMGRSGSGSLLWLATAWQRQRGRDDLTAEGITRHRTVANQSRSACTLVSAGAKIPIVPVENAATPEVLTRTDSENRGGTACARGKRRGRDQRAQAARLEQPGDHSFDGIRPGNNREISVEADR
jgi:hypothetical protein